MSRASKIEYLSELIEKVRGKPVSIIHLELCHTNSELDTAIEYYENTLRFIEEGNS